MFQRNRRTASFYTIAPVGYTPKEKKKKSRWKTRWKTLLGFIKAAAVEDPQRSKETAAAAELERAIEARIQAIVQEETKQIRKRHAAALQQVDMEQKEARSRRQEDKATEINRIREKVRRDRRQAYQNKMQTIKKKKRRQLEDRYHWRHWTDAEKRKMIQLCRKYGYLTKQSSDEEWMHFYQAFPQHTVPDVRHQVRQSHAEFSRLKFAQVQHLQYPTRISNAAEYSVQKLRNLSTR